MLKKKYDCLSQWSEYLNGKNYNFMKYLLVISKIVSVDKIHTWILNSEYNLICTDDEKTHD